MKKLITFFSFLIIGISTQAQDFVFSQFHLSPLNLNPALVGTNCGDQVIVNYRDQWGKVLGDAAYKTLSVSYDRPIQLESGDVIGVGAKFVNNEAGRSDFSINSGSLLLSYQKRIFKNNKTEHFLIGGFEGGLTQQTVDYSGLRWGTQHDGNGGFDSTLVSGENLENDKVLFGDFAGGVAYQIKFDEQRSVTIGASINHLFRPNVSPNNSEDAQLYRKFALHASYDLKLSDNFIISPRAVYFTQGPTELLIASLAAKYYLKEHIFEVNVGQRFIPLGRQAYFIAPVFFMNNKIGFAATAEFNANELNRNGIDSYEGSIIYRFCKKAVEIPE